MDAQVHQSNAVLLKVLQGDILVLINKELEESLSQILVKYHSEILGGVHRIDDLNVALDLTRSNILVSQEMPL